MKFVRGLWRNTTGVPNAIDVFEPVRVAEAVKDVELEHVVITSVDRDDLIDGGADNLQILFMRLEKVSLYNYRLDT